MSAILRPLGAVLAVAGIGWRRLWRDPQGLAFTFLAPVGVAAVMIGAYRSQDAGDGYTVGVVVAGGDDAIAGHLRSRLDASPVLDVDRYDDRGDAERAVRRRDVAAAVVIPGAAAGTPVATVELVGPPEIAAPTGVRAAVEAVVADTAAALRLGRTLQPGAPDATALAAGQVALDMAGGSTGTVATGRPDPWDPAALAVVGTLVLFVTMNTMASSSLLPELHERGVVTRMRTTPASPRQIAAGFGLGLASYALVLAVLVLATGRIAFGITWASWPALAAVVVVLGLVAGALGLVTGTFLPSLESGTTIAGPAGFVLGMLGGCLWPLEMVGPVLAGLGHLTPQAWAVESLRATAVGGDGLVEVAGGLAVLLAFAAGLLLLGGRRLGRRTADEPASEPARRPGRAAGWDDGRR